MILFPGSAAVQSFVIDVPFMGSQAQQLYILNLGMQNKVPGTAAAGDQTNMFLSMLLPPLLLLLHPDHSI
jgi:hypothetical protein